MPSCVCLLISNSSRRHTEEGKNITVLCKWTYCLSWFGLFKACHTPPLSRPHATTCLAHMLGRVNQELKRTDMHWCAQTQNKLLIKSTQKQHLNIQTGSQAQQAQASSRTHTSPHTVLFICTHWGPALRMRGFPAWCSTAVGRHPARRQPDAELWPHRKGVTEKTSRTRSEAELWLSELDKERVQT